MAEEIRIHPLDLESDVAIGILLDITGPSGKIFNQSYTTLEQAKTNFKCLLLTNEGERVMQPDFGCSIRKHLFNPIVQDLRTNIKETIISKTEYWLPYIQILELEVEAEEDANFVFIKITFSLLDNEFDTETINLKFNLTR
jgi:phage baseplate assembly protein W